MPNDAMPARNPPPRAAARLSVVIVTFNSREAVQRSLPPLLEQLEPDDELLIVDNASEDGTPEAVARLAPAATLIRNARNEGFAAACNSGGRAASGGLLVFVNPDAVPASGFCEAIRRPLAERRGWAAWMGLVTADHGSIVNTSGGVIHFTGIAWAGESGRPSAELSRSPREVPFVSGACLAVPREIWRAEGGFPAEFFMYCEDVDLSLRLRLAGGSLGLEPDARVDHEYDFAKGPAKWRLLERNRWATIVRCYPAALLAAVAPALLLTELALAMVALRGGWGAQKLLAATDTARALPRLIGERRGIQRRRRVSAAEFAAWLTPELSSPYLPGAARFGLLQWGLRLYWSAVRALLRVPRRT